MYDPNSRFGGLLCFLGPDGQKHTVEIGGRCSRYHLVRC
ncbi:MAG: hypothetical protein ACREYC_13575 [Gammaproteobacteria bacterium]